MSARDELEMAIEAGWKEFERITASPLPFVKGGYKPSRGAFEFALKTTLAALSVSVQPERDEQPK